MDRETALLRAIEILERIFFTYCHFKLPAYQPVYLTLNIVIEPTKFNNSIQAEV